METQKEVLVQDKFRTLTACGGGARSFGLFFEWMGRMRKTITAFIGATPRHQLECHNVHQRVMSWLQILQQNNISNQKLLKCCPHSYPQASFLIDPQNNNNTHANLVILSHLHELPAVFQLVGFDFNKQLASGNTAFEDPIKTQFLPANVSLLYEETLQALCHYLALDYYLFHFETPSACLQDLSILPLLKLTRETSCINKHQ